MIDVCTHVLAHCHRHVCARKSFPGARHGCIQIGTGRACRRHESIQLVVSGHGETQGMNSLCMLACSLLRELARSLARGRAGSLARSVACMHARSLAHLLARSRARGLACSLARGRAGPLAGSLARGFARLHARGLGPAPYNTKKIHRLGPPSHFLVL